MKTNLKTWMSQIEDDKDLFTLTIPGTHDSVTQYVQISHICQTQDANIYEQLCMGIRALDIRVNAKDNRLKMVHAFANAYTNSLHLGSPMDMRDVLEYCYKFLNENPSEAIIFQFKDDTNDHCEQCFSNLFYTYIKGNEDKWYLENRIPTLKEARGKIVLIRRCKMDAKNCDFTPLNTGIDFSQWVDQEQVELTPEPVSLTTKGEHNAEFIIQDRFKYKPQERWDECLKPFLDSMEEFKGKYIINYTSTAGGYKGPKYNSDIINKLFIDYPLDKEKYYGTIYLDFPTEDLTTKIINHNFK